ncbi:MAG: HIT family protein [Burkholderiales bacterium]
MFCAILAGEAPARIVYSDERHVAFLPLTHINPGHVLLIPRVHYPDIFAMPPVDYRRLWATVARLGPKLRQVSKAIRIGIALEGFSVPHVHVHLVPTNAGNELDPNRAKPLCDADADLLAAKLRLAFNGLAQNRRTRDR